VRFCPYCGQPLGSFFGARIEGGGAWCDRCQECFRVLDVEESEDISAPANSAPGDEPTGEQ
jgi:hypothetical protein